MSATRWFAMVMLTACAAGAVAAAEAVPTPADIDRAVAAVASWEFGQGRGPLTEVERLVGATRGRADLRAHLEGRFVRLLEGQATQEGKLFVCEQLWRIGSEAALPVLAKMLRQEETAHMACLGLARTASPQALEVLREALGEAKGKALVAVIGVLGDRADAGSLPALGRLAASGDALVAEAALAALGRIGGDEAARVLAGARKQGPEPLRAVATDSYLQCAAKMATAGRKDQAAALYKDVLAGDTSALVHRAALLGMMRVAGADAVPLVLKTLAGNDPEMKAAVIAHIPAIEGQGVTERFAQELPNLPDDLQVLLIGALVERADAAVRPTVLKAAQGPSAAVRAAALKALGRVGDASTVGLLAGAAAKGDSAEEKQAALGSLRGLRGEGVDAAIVESLQGAQGEARAELVIVLHDRGATGAVPAILKEAGNADAGVRAAAFKALGMLAGPKDLPAMVDLLIGLTGEGGRTEAETAVIAVSRKVGDESAQADAALAGLAKAQGAEAKGSLLGVLRGIGGAKALATVQGALKDSDASVQDAAVRALAAWPDARATASVLDIYRTTPSATHRVLALRGAVRLLAMAGPSAGPDTLKAYRDVMAGVRTPEERKLVLAGLAGLNHPDALAMAMACLEDPAVRAEAGLAAIAVARAVMGTHPQETKAAMGKLAAAAPSDDLKKQARDLAARIGEFGDFIMAWQVSGPYLEAGQDYLKLFDTVFAPEAADAKGAEWRVLPASLAAGTPPIFDLLAALGGGDNRVAYVRTWIRSDKAQDARLELGTDDGCKVWLNGQVVHANNTGRAAVAGTDKVDVALKPGANLLLVKVTQCTGPWGFCVRPAKRDGGRLGGVTFSLQGN